MLAGDIVEHRLVDGKGGGACVAVIVAEGTLAPTATLPLQQQEFAWHFGVYE